MAPPGAAALLFVDDAADFACESDAGAFFTSGFFVEATSGLSALEAAPGLEGNAAEDADLAAEDNSGLETDVVIVLPPASGLESVFESVLGRGADLT